MVLMGLGSAAPPAQAVDDQLHVSPTASGGFPGTFQWACHAYIVNPAAVETKVDYCDYTLHHLDTGVSTTYHALHTVSGTNASLAAGSAVDLETGYWGFTLCYKAHAVLADDSVQTVERCTGSV